MSDAPYERYKDALRRGHVAALRGRLDAALVAYGEAADIAPERALPHVSLAGILTRLARPEEALAEYGRALDRSPGDGTALAGRAELLASLGRRAEAAQDLDALAAAQEREGRVAEACDTARRALQLAESKSRRRLVEALASRLRASPDGEAEVRTIEAAMTALEPPVIGISEPAAESAADATTAEAGAAEPEAFADGARLTTEAQEVIDAGDTAAAHALLLEAARAHRAAGRVNAALDACYLALGINAFDFDIHVLLTELYLEQGWRAPAAEKLLLLGRLVDLDGDAAGHARICRIAAAEFPEDERLTAMCA